LRDCSVGQTSAYICGDWSLDIHFCPICGCVTHWRGRAPVAADRKRIAVNLRLAAPGPVAVILLQRLDGLVCFDDLSGDGRCVADVRF